MYLLNHNLLSHQTWPIDVYQQEQGIIWTIWRTGNKFQALFNLVTSSNYSITNYDKIMFHYVEKVNKGYLNVKCQIWKMTRFLYVVVLVKLWKGLELVPSFQHWTKNILEMFVIEHISIWPNFISIALKIPKK